MFTINLGDGREAPSKARKKGAKRLVFLVSYKNGHIFCKNGYIFGKKMDIFLIKTFVKTWLYL